MNKKTYYIEDRENWGDFYGSLLFNLQNITTFLKYVNKYKNIENDQLNILDYGCAYGYYLQILKAINKFINIYGVDIAKEAVIKAQDRVGIEMQNIFWLENGENIPILDNFFDVVFCLDVIEHINSQELLVVFNEIKRVMKSETIFFVVTPNCNIIMKIIYFLTNKKWIYKGKAHVNTHSKKSLTRLLQKYFKIKEIEYYNHKTSLFRNFLSFFGVSTHLIAIVKK
ncbi:methyltransferase domain-containing protein [Patescibacteria group bacterium]|nr:methyltransferase domain-containing protein [Patescibacteria group bacterium]